MGQLDGVVLLVCVCGGGGGGGDYIKSIVYYCIFLCPNSRRVGGALSHPSSS